MNNETDFTQLLLNMNTNELSASMNILKLESHLYMCILNL